MCIINHYPLGNQRTEISGGLNISEKYNTIYITLHRSIIHADVNERHHWYQCAGRLSPHWRTVAGYTARKVEERTEL